MDEVYSSEQKLVAGMQVNTITMRPGREERLLPLQEIALDKDTMQELAEKAIGIGVKVWKGNTSHQDILR